MKIFLLLFTNVILLSAASQRKNDPSNFLVYSTIKIEAQTENIVNQKKQIFSGTGTGFFFEFKTAKGFVPVIITNKHVVQGASKGILYFKSQLIKDSLTEKYKIEKVVIPNFSNYCITHPDTSVDLVIIPIAPIEREYASKGIALLRATYIESDIPGDSITKDLSAIEEIFMIGYPFGLRDLSNDMPIVRKGITATPPYLNYNSRSEFLCDLPVYPGSSGSPIVIFNSGSYSTKVGIAFGTRLILLGINYATYNRNFEGKVVPKVTYNIEDSLKVNVPIPYNIGIAIKSNRLLEFKSAFK